MTGRAAELLVDPADRRLLAALVQPEHQAEGEEVLGQVDLLAGHVEAFERARVERRDRDLEDGVRLERAVGQRVARVGRLVEVLLGERVAVDDQRAARRQVADVRLERRRVHRHEDVRLVAGRVDVRRREADLEARHAGQRAGRGADLGREVGQRADVVAEDRRGPGELRAGQLHPVAGIAGEPDGDPFELADVRVELLGGCHAPSGSFMRWLVRGGRLSSSSGNDSARSLIGSAISFAAESNEKLTGLPLHPGLAYPQEVDSQVCGKNAKMILYDASPDASLAEYVTWYKQQLKSFHYVHKTWSDRPQESFFSPDGSKGIGITGTPDGKRVFAVTYMKFSSNLTTQQEDAFDPSNPSCK